MKKFWAIKDSLSIDDGLIVYGCRLLIPISLRATMLSRLHEAHQGIARSQARARLTIYWPNMNQDIQDFVSGCRHCQDHLPSNAQEPLVVRPAPDRPFQQIAVDFASYGGKQFLIMVDCKTDWPDMVEMSNHRNCHAMVCTVMPWCVLSCHGVYCHVMVCTVMSWEGDKALKCLP